MMFGYGVFALPKGQIGVSVKQAGFALSPSGMIALLNTPYRLD